MLKLPERDRDVLVYFIKNAISTTHNTEQSVNLVNFLGKLQPVDKPKLKKPKLKK